MNRLRIGLLATSLLALSGGTAFADYELNILHINDLHSRIEPINKYDSTCSAEDEGKNACFGGIARVKAAIDARRKALTDAGANVLVLDAGDQFQGSLFYTAYKSAAVADFMNGIGFDAMAVGNHEFDNGPEELAKFLDKATFPIISGNTVAGADTPIANRIPGYVVKDIGGQKVAIVSVLATDTGETSSPGKSVFFEDEIAYLKSVIPTIQAEGVNKIVLLSHVGYWRDQEIARAVDGIDVIVGGHSHTLLSNTDEKAIGPYPTFVRNPAGVDVPIVQAYAYSKYLGDLKVVFDDAGNVKSTSGAPILLDSAFTPDAGFTAKVKELAGPLEEMKSKIVAETAAPIDGRGESCRAGECEMGNLLADALLDRTRGQGVTAVITNGGGLRASIDAGPVSMGEVITVLPFQNTVSTFGLKGSDIVVALENGLSEIEGGAGRFPQVAGMKFTFDTSKPAGHRVVSVEMQEGGAFVPLDPDKVYTLASNNYMRAGGDGYEIFATAATNAYDYGPTLDEVLADYLAAHQPYKPYLDGRIATATGTAAAPSTTPAPSGTATAAPAAAPAPSTAASKHIVVRGDTLWELAEDAYGDGFQWRRISEANGNPKPRALAIGSELEVPAK
ncbi:5'-nucleotidase C-terminal domain-containing protein [Rhizobium sp. TRM96647]|uniref:5'-nucleotidase C-terminal domain-containing protein n=1 Tax=unclassified Rhizobium TaxID=2613769 RepID=UPI0021E70DFF|nr:MULTISPECIES: 5'-nucleotidase C-terminal domain-containing protein [unclassified Rhizobium]MCV3735924.1 5'-nucleotidase C-terminal domain-containing protein [Rhizobium sp. TRM96647]MCV3758414.1 5'-nucleotidase C-terminal domain-containing protein [Rhizobium sp. TRM96650]